MEELHSLAFPSKVSIDVIQQFINKLYPKLHFEFHQIDEKQYLVRTDLLGNLQSRLIKLTRNILTLGLVFEVKHTKQRIQIITSLVLADQNDPFLKFSQQFPAAQTLDILSLLDRPFQLEYLHGLIFLMEKDYRSASSKLATVGEHFGQKIILDYLPNDYLYGSPGVVQFKQDTKKASKNFNQLIECISPFKLQRNKSLYQAISEKSVLSTIYYSLHLIRVLRNRIHHPSDAFIDYYSEVLLSLLRNLTIELESICSFMNL